MLGRSEHTWHITMHGVVVNDRLVGSDNVSSLFASCSSLLYTLRVLRTKPWPTRTVANRCVSGYSHWQVLYCASTWYGASVQLLTGILASLWKTEIPWHGGDSPVMAVMLFRKVLSNNIYMNEVNFPSLSGRKLLTNISFIQRPLNSTRDTFKIKHCAKALYEH